MLNWLTNNKEWIFSGVGIYSLILIYKLITKVRRKSPQNLEPSSHAMNISVEVKDPRIELQPPTIKPITDITAKAIADTIYKDTPLLQREEAIKHYLGIRVKWDTTLHSATQEGERIRMALYTNDSRLIICDVLKTDYSGLGLLKPHHPISVEGELCAIDPLWFEMENVKLYFTLETPDKPSNKTLKKTRKKPRAV